jgi:hypothetical protein
MITNMRTLRATAKAGHIKLHRDTGFRVRHWLGPWVRAVYVNGLDSKRRFRYRGQDYELRYLEGCFSPFVFHAKYPDTRGHFA